METFLVKISVQFLTFKAGMSQCTGTQGNVPKLILSTLSDIFKIFNYWCNKCTEVYSQHTAPYN